MDFEKLIASRERSIKRLTAECNELRARASDARNKPDMAAYEVFSDMLKVKTARLDRLLREREAFEALRPDPRQGSLLEPSGKPEAGAVTGRGHLKKR